MSSAAREECVVPDLILPFSFFETNPFWLESRTFSPFEAVLDLEYAARRGVERKPRAWMERWRWSRKRTMSLLSRFREKGFEGAQEAAAFNPESRGFVYFVQRRDGAIKIGRAVNPASRFTALRRQHGDLTALAVVPVKSMNSAEQRLHRKLREARLDGEWFAISPVAVAALAAEAAEE